MKIKIGTQIGNWEVISEKFRKDSIYWHLCECICGKKKEVRAWHLNNNKTKGCGCTNVKGRFKFNGIGDLSASYITSFSSSRKAKGIPFSDELTLEYLWNLFLEQGKKCALSGLPISLNKQWSKQNKGQETEVIQTASLDRIDNGKGYEVGNVQWVHKDINYMKGGMDEANFISFCHAVANNNTQIQQVNLNSKRTYFKRK